MGKIPVRVWIGAMVFFSTYINYATMVNMAMSIVSMVKGKAKKIPECLENTNKILSFANRTHELPDYGPRYHWNEHDQGLILGGYFWGYTLFAFFGGTAAEKLGPSKIIFAVGVCATIFNFLCVDAVKLHFAALVTCRFLIGAAGGLQYPALHVLISRWAPPQERGKFLACMMGNTLATCVTWPSSGWIITHLGWKWSFYIISAQQVIYCIVFYSVATDSPDDHKYISREEINYIKESQGDSLSTHKQTAPFKRILTSRPFYMLMLLHYGNVWGLYVQLQSVPKFLSEVIGFNLKEAGVIAALPHISRLLYAVAIGNIGDHLKKKGVRAVVLRKSFILSSHILPGILMLGICFADCNWIPTVILLTVSCCFNGAVVMTNLQNHYDLSPNFAGSVYSIISGVGGTTGFIVPSMVAFFIHDHNGFKEWSNTFLLGGTIYIVTGVAFILFGSVEVQPWNKLNE